MCPKCTRDVETCEHIFRDCPSIAEIWRKRILLSQDIIHKVESYIRDVDVVQRKLHVRREIILGGNYQKLGGSSGRLKNNSKLSHTYEFSSRGPCMSSGSKFGDRFRDSIGDGRRGRLVSDRKDESCTYTIKRGVDERWEYLSGRVCVGLCEGCDGQRSARMTVGGRGKKWWRCSLMASQETLM
ncbi:hypothetical protein Gohar_017627, partial [Gossypium harknessii]|nr:hypothetical protein [Gossypium harknessii]